MTTELSAPKQAEAASVTPMKLIEAANAAGHSVESMAQLFDLQMRWEANEARKAFNAAMAQFKKDPPQINKNVQKKAGSIDLNYASLDNVVETIAPSLAAVGIRHRWENKQDAALISVTCILSHDLGYSESTTLAAMPDGSGSKNPVQAIASTVTYLQRYTLLGATGMAAVGTDTDGNPPKSEPSQKMPDHELAEHIQYIEAASSMADLEKLYLLALKEADDLGDNIAKGKIAAAKKMKKQELADAPR